MVLPKITEGKRKENGRRTEGKHPTRYGTLGKTTLDGRDFLYNGRVTEGERKEVKKVVVKGRFFLIGHIYIHIYMYLDIFGCVLDIVCI